jgi:transcriptional regulator with XRE-family HTH domain
MKAIQLKMARAAVGLGVRELAELAGVTANTITRIENGADAKQSTIDALRTVLERDVIFLSDGETTSGGPGVRLRDLA